MTLLGSERRRVRVRQEAMRAWVEAARRASATDNCWLCEVKTVRWGASWYMVGEAGWRSRVRRREGSKLESSCVALWSGRDVGG